MQSQMEPATSGTRSFSIINEIMIGASAASLSVDLAHNALVNQTLHAGAIGRAVSTGEVSG